MWPVAIVDRVRLAVVGPPLVARLAVESSAPGAGCGSHFKRKKTCGQARKAVIVRELRGPRNGQNGSAPGRSACSSSADRRPRVRPLKPAARTSGCAGAGPAPPRCRKRRPRKPNNVSPAGRADPTERNCYFDGSGDQASTLRRERAALCLFSLFFPPRRPRKSLETIRLRRCCSASSPVMCPRGHQNLRSSSTQFFRFDRDFVPAEAVVRIALDLTKRLLAFRAPGPS